MPDIQLTLVPWAPGTPVGAYPKRSEQMLPEQPPTGITAEDTQIVADDASLLFPNLIGGDYFAAAPLNGDGTWHYVTFAVDVDDIDAVAALRSPDGQWHQVTISDDGRLSTVDIGTQEPPHGPPPYVTLAEYQSGEGSDDARLDALEAIDADARLDSVESSSALSALSEGVVGTVGGTGTGDQSAALQAWNNKCRTEGRMGYLPPLVYRITSPVRFDTPMDCTGATIYWAGSSTGTGAVKVGPVDGTTPLFRVNMVLPKIIQGTKTWGGSDIGLVIESLFASNVTIQLIQDFSIGWDLAGLAGVGTAGAVSYNTFNLGGLANNKINQRLKPVAANGPFVNQNTFIGGQFSHGSGEASPGTKHVQLVMPGLQASGWYQPNNNVWINPSLEGYTVEYDIDCDGANNVWFMSRHEGDGSFGDHKARFSGIDPARRAMRNVIWTGFEGPNLAIEHGSNAIGNQIMSFGDFVRLSGGSADGTLALSNYGSDSAASLIVAPFANFHTNDLETTYTVSISSAAIKIKGSGLANPLVQIDTASGLISLGSGAVAPDINLARAVVDGVATFSFNAPLRLSSSAFAGYLTGVEQSGDPGAPAANGWKLYAKDISGKTMMHVRDASRVEAHPGSLTGTATWDPASLVAGASEKKSVTVTGAVVGDIARAGLSTIAATGWEIQAVVIAADTVEVKITNNTGGPVDLASGTVRAVVEKWS